MWPFPKWFVRCTDFFTNIKTLYHCGSWPIMNVGVCRLIICISPVSVTWSLIFLISSYPNRVTIHTTFPWFLSNFSVGTVTIYQYTVYMDYSILELFCDHFQIAHARRIFLTSQHVIASKTWQHWWMMVMMVCNPMSLSTEKFILSHNTEWYQVYVLVDLILLPRHSGNINLTPSCTMLCVTIYTDYCIPVLFYDHSQIVRPSGFPYLSNQPML